MLPNSKHQSLSRTCANTLVAPDAREVSDEIPAGIPARSALLILCCRGCAKSVRAKGKDGPLSQRVVAYAIDAKYDPAKHTVEATETLTYHNLTGQPLDTFPFHLYLNGFQPKSTWIHEAHRDGNFRTSSLGRWKPGLRLQRRDVVAKWWAWAT